MVITLKTTDELQAHRASVKDQVGVVLTMGNLHLGHLSLLEKALLEFETVYFSIFVNPKQFAPNEDFAKYPRTLENDLNLIETSAKKFPKAEIVVFAPKDPAEIYPPGYDQVISVKGVTSMLEGAKRPTHFDGVTTVVYRLFDLMKPTKTYFGLKDYQQCLTIKKMVKDLALPIEVVGMPIVREPSGLALSSRNQYLSPEQKQEALILSRTLKELDALIDGKKRNLGKADAFIQNKLTDPRWNYLDIRDAETLSKDLEQSTAITILAVFQLGATRLLDNMQLELQ